MWYIESVFSRGTDGHSVAHEEPCIFSDPNFRQDNDIFVKLRDSETNILVRLTGECGKWDRFNDLLLHYDPYGLTRVDCARYMLTAIDKMSLSFLDLIEDIKIVTPVLHSELWEMMSKYRMSFFFWDAEKTIVDCPSRLGSVRYTFPIFQVICFMQRGWLDDKFYLRATDGDAIEVSFVNAPKARALIGKAAMNHRSMLIKWSRIKDDLFIRQQ